MQSQIALDHSLPTVTFWGAARTLTGSMHLIEFGKHKLLLDCGAYRGPRQDLRRRNSAFPFHAPELDAVVLSHAHSDHCGHLPTLVRHGFTGPIYCTPATRDLLAVTLTDSARVRQEDARVLSVLGHDPEGFAEPFYSREDVVNALSRCESMPFEELRGILPGIRLRLLQAGHLLGAAMVELHFDTDNGEKSLIFTGDVGHRGLPLLPDPAPLPAADLLICECTYGGKTHQPLNQVREILNDVIRRTAERGGKVFIPAFSLGRTQSIVHTVRQEIEAGRVPPVPIFVDSPLGADVADVYRQHLRELDAVNAAPTLQDGSIIHYIRDPQESHALTLRREPCVVVASGGMCEGGRILQHLKHNIDDPRCSIVLVSYQAAGTPGRQLLERRPTVHFHGRNWNKWAEVIDLNGFSAHADHNDLLNLLTPIAGRVHKVCLVHGESDRAEALRTALTARGFADVIIPEEGQTVGV